MINDRVWILFNKIQFISMMHKKSAWIRCHFKILKFPIKMDHNATLSLRISDIRKTGQNTRRKYIVTCHRNIELIHHISFRINLNVFKQKVSVCVPSSRWQFPFNSPLHSIFYCIVFDDTTTRCIEQQNCDFVSYFDNNNAKMSVTNK